MTNDERARHRRGDPEAGKQEKCSTIAVTWERSLKTARGGGMVSHHRSRSGLTRTGQSGPGTCTRRVGWPSTGPCRLQPRGPPPQPFPGTGQEKRLPAAPGVESIACGRRRDAEHGRPTWGHPHEAATGRAQARGTGAPSPCGNRGKAARMAIGGTHRSPWPRGSSSRRSCECTSVRPPPS